MYIGPWQEYNLSRKQANPTLNPAIRNEIEKAIQDSLDPESAKIALKAMNPYLGNISNDIPRKPPPRRRNTRNNDGSPFLPPINILLHPEARMRRDNQISSPMSVRSTKSEPIQSTRLPAISVSTNDNGAKSARRAPPMVESPKAVPSVEKQPPYNAPAMLNLLRLERARDASNQIKALTGWKGVTRSVDRTVEESTESKIEQVNAMKQVYLSRSNGPQPNLLPSLTNKTVLGSEVELGGTAKRPYTDSINSNGASPLQTPRIDDLALTHSELNIVSKYFNNTPQPPEKSVPPAAATAVLLSPILSRPLKGIPAGSSSNSLKSGSASPTKGRKDSTGSVECAIVTDNLQTEEDTTLEIGSPDMDNYNLDELYVGGIDGLLKWSAQLDYQF